MAQVILTAPIDAVVPPITLAMLGRPSPLLHERLANPRRKRRQAINYPNGRLSWCLWGRAPNPARALPLDTAKANGASVLDAARFVLSARKPRNVFAGVG